MIASLVSYAFFRYAGDHFAEVHLGGVPPWDRSDVALSIAKTTALML